MASIDLNDYFYFVHVVEKGGFTRAAESLGIPKSRLSRHVVKLEERLGTVLVQRTTRQFRVTEMGDAFYQHARAALDQVDLAEAAVRRDKQTLQGQVTISCSVGVAQFALKGLLSRFMADNPRVVVLQQVTNQYVDLIASGVDLCIRGHVDSLPDSSLVQRQLATVAWHLFASPRYLHGAAPITAPDQLAEHQTLALGWQAPDDRWTLEQDTGATHTIRVVPRLKSEDMATLKQAAVDALGIVALPAYTCRQELTSEQLVRVLPAWHAGRATLSLVMPGRRGLAAPVAALKAFLENEFAEVVAMRAGPQANARASATSQ